MNMLAQAVYSTGNYLTKEQTIRLVNEQVMNLVWMSICLFVVFIGLAIFLAVVAWQQKKLQRKIEALEKAQKADGVAV